jgi:hypothetical protein
MRLDDEERVTRAGDGLRVDLAAEHGEIIERKAPGV